MAEEEPWTPVDYAINGAKASLTNAYKLTTSNIARLDMVLTLDFSLKHCSLSLLSPPFWFWDTFCFLLSNLKMSSIRNDLRNRISIWKVTESKTFARFATF